MERLVTERNGVNIIPLSRRLFHSRSELEYLKKRLDAYKERVGHGSLLSSKVPNGSHKHLEQLALARFLAGRFDHPSHRTPVLSPGPCIARFDTVLTYCERKIDGPLKRLQ